jgi:hypothetical protein
VFRSPFVQSPIPGRPATPLLTTLAGETTEFEAVIRPIKPPAAWA